MEVNSVIIICLVFMLLHNSDSRPTTDSLQLGPECGQNYPLHLQCPEHKYCHIMIGECVPCYNCTKRGKEEHHTGCALNEDMCGDCLPGYEREDLLPSADGQQRYRCKWIPKTSESPVPANSTYWRETVPIMCAIIFIGILSVVLIGLYIRHRKAKRNKKEYTEVNSCSTVKEIIKSDSPPHHPLPEMSSAHHVPAAKLAVSTPSQISMKRYTHRTFLEELNSEESYVMEDRFSEDGETSVKALPTDRADEELSRRHHQQTHTNFHQSDLSGSHQGRKTTEERVGRSKSYGTQPLPGESEQMDESENGSCGLSTFSDTTQMIMSRYTPQNIPTSVQSNGARPKTGNEEDVQGQS